MDVRWPKISLLFIALVAQWPVTVRAQSGDTYESGSPRWRLVDSDCKAQLALSEMSLSFPHGGQACELMELFCANGTYAYMATPIEPAAIIDELAPSIWVQCMGGHIRIGANVVFPNATHPSTGGRLHTILWGDSYDDPGQWQKLQLKNCEQLLSQEIIAIRGRFGAKVDFEGAYVDSIVLNVYTGPGRYRLKVDDLYLQGAVPISSLGFPVAIDWRQRWRWRDGSNSEELRWLQQTPTNRLPVWWQYQGESMPWLHSIGFRGLMLNRFPSEEMLNEARSARLTVISPPPSRDLAVENEVWDTVKGWIIGAALDSRGMKETREEVSRVGQLQSNLRRNTIAEALEDYWAFSRVVDEVVVPIPSNISAGSVIEKSQWLTHSLRDSSKRGSSWVSIATEALPSWYEQIREAQRIVEQTAPEIETTDAMQLRLQVARAVAAGARGFVLRSTTPLDINNSDHRVRIAAMRSINRDLAFIGPWITGGQIAPVPKIDRQDYDQAAWNASRSHLIMFINSDPQSQYSLPPTRDRPLKATMPLPSGIHKVLRVTGGSVETLLLTPSAEGMTWEIKEPAPIEFCVLTDNPVVERYVSRQLSQTAVESAEDWLDIAGHQLQVASRITAARWPEPQDALSKTYYSTITAAQVRVEQGFGELRANRPGRAVDAAAQALDAAQMIIYESFQTATSNLSSPQSSPLVLSPASLHYHWSLARSCQRSQWRELALPGDDLANLNAMLEFGWSQQRRLDERAELLVELMPRVDNSILQPGLRLAAVPRSGQVLPGGYEGASIRVRSAPASAERGELVRVTARAIVRKSPVEPGAGLLVYDNKCGPALGQLVRGEPGQVVPIELYRFVTDNTPFRLLTELRGECDIVLEGIKLSAIQPAVNQSYYPTQNILPTNSQLLERTNPRPD